MKITTIFFVILYLLGSSQHEFKPLPYAYDALEPYIDAQTMQLHYDKHHRSYYNNFISTFKTFPELEKMSMEEVFSNINKYDVKVRNNGGGFWNHEFFWNCMISGGRPLPDGEFAKIFLKQWGSMDNFKKEFKEAALSVFGSGWAWLIVDKDKKLKITTTPNQDNPLMSVVSDRGYPILGLDVWEHAYYLKYQNRRAEYVENFFNVINWEQVVRNYEKFSR
ncbi:MAG: superoxide dismutase [Bacteroidales bacterium]|nr:superoxide dismutase [Bacteroidales bacterium]